MEVSHTPESKGYYYLLLEQEMRWAFLFIGEPAQISPSGPSYSPPKLLGVLAAHILLCEWLLVKGQPLWPGCLLCEFKGQAPLSPCGVPLKRYSNSRIISGLRTCWHFFISLFFPLPKPAFLTPAGVLKDILP